MKNSNSRVIFLALALIASLVMGYSLTSYLHKEAAQQGDAPTKELKQRFGMFSSDNSQSGNNTYQAKAENIHDVEVKGFMEKLYKARSSEDLNLIFNGLLEITSGKYDYMNEYYHLFNKWGKIAPKQALEKINLASHRVFPQMHGVVYYAWAENDPEAVAHYYEELSDVKGEETQWLPYVISSCWAKYSPEKAWSWLEGRKDRLPEEDYEEAKKMTAKKIAEEFPQESLPYLNSLDEKTRESLLFSLSLKWNQEKEDQIPHAWIQNQPEQARACYEAGRIMAVSKGELKSLQNQISQLPEEQQSRVIEEITIPLIRSGGLNMNEKVDWIISSLSEEQISTNLEIREELGSWFLEDRSDAEAWWKNLPEGKKKEALKKHFDQDSYLILY